jgi:2-polyprenyl-3-methyl-5-hydroxy-6-metoxy-1,4-benzoquinol methylase
MRTVCVIQCNHVGWEGTTDISLRNDPDGRQVIEEVISRAQRLIGIDDGPVVACPDLPENRIFGEIANKFGCPVYYGSNTDVLKRLREACLMFGGERIAWLQGIHYFLDVALMSRLIAWSNEFAFDYARCKDGSCKQILGQVVSIVALDRVAAMIGGLDEDERCFFSARPFAFMRSHPQDFKVGLFQELPTYSEESLRQMRQTATEVYVEGRALHAKAGCSIGDVSRGRYLEILSLVPAHSSGLDIACGTGYGSKLLAGCGNTVVGIDLDQETIEFAQRNNSGAVEFRVGNAEQIPAEDNSFDATVSIATIEHVSDDNKFIAELSRVLKTSGKLILYTPQNRMGSIPIWPHHVREYDIDSLKAIIHPFFRIEHVMGWQNGVVTFDEECGDGMYLIGINRKS